MCKFCKRLSHEHETLLFIRVNVEALVGISGNIIYLLTCFVQILALLFIRVNVEALLGISGNIIYLLTCFVQILA